MGKYFEKEITNIPNIKLTPGKPAACLGNGEHGFECCCDECDYFLLCFPEFDPENTDAIIAVGNVPKDNSKF